MQQHPHVLIATLGGQPQIVTFTLDLLLQAGFPICDVFVVHPRAVSPSRLAQSLSRLNAEFPGHTYTASGQTIHFHSCALALDGAPIDDIRDEAHADGALNTLHQLIGDLKRQGYRIHLSLTGGRRLMSLLAIPVALFNFDRHDYIWHLYTPDEVKAQANEGQLMHVPPAGGTRLIQGPFIPLGAYAYDPAQPFRLAQEEQRSQMELQERAHCAEVERQATNAQLRVLRAFAKGLKPQQAADELCISLATLNSHKTKLFDYCYNAWNLPREEHLDYRFLATKFAPYFQDE